MRNGLTYSILSSLTVVLILIVTGACGQQEDISKILWTANWSHDDKYIAVGGVDKKIRIFSGKSFELLKVLENNTEIQRMSWHPYLNLLAVAAIGDGSKLIDIEKDSIIYMKSANANGTRAMAWNHQGELLANADYEGEITIWNQGGELILRIKKENTISNVAIDWHPTKDEFVTLSDEFVRIYNSEGRLLNKFKHRKENVLMLCVKWHKSGEFFVIGDYGDKGNGYKPLLQYWKSNGTLLKQINISKSEYRNVSWTKRGDKLATASDVLRVWTKNGDLIAEGFSADDLWGVDWSSDGKFIVTSSFDGHIKIWDGNAKLIHEIKY
jgi:WD40 repeat protein